MNQRLQPLVIVTGSSGLIGATVCERLAAIPRLTVRVPA